MQARIKRLYPLLPTYQTPDSAAFDIAANADTIIPARGFAKVSTGLVIEAPEGHFLLIAARSSLALKTGLLLANGIGIVDRDYAGPTDEILISLYNPGEKPVLVQRGDRIAQGLFLKVTQAEWQESDMLRPENRGGFGSTGGYQNLP